MFQNEVTLGFCTLCVFVYLFMEAFDKEFEEKYYISESLTA